MKLHILLRIPPVALLPIALAMSCSSNQPQILSPEPATSPTKQAEHNGVKKALDETATNHNESANTNSSETLLQRATNGPSSKQIVTEAEVVEIVKQHVLYIAPSAKFKISTPRFSAGKWSVAVNYLPLGPGRHVFYEVTAEGDIIDRRGGY